MSAPLSFGLFEMKPGQSMNDLLAFLGGDDSRVVLGNDIACFHALCDTVLARAQRPEALPIGEWPGTVWDAAFDTLARARSEVRR